ncbi:MAG: diacylglycerol kinase family lipid kinase [Anaerolineales bacterium]|nr:diacylglycerol kinase family lipid kinase [Anaerolineales bacterium]MBP6209874.1 diacylglycerol kinase family lipid kinase [Anaerolineales bacterium]MBP8164731.1 diacylglycerol kinase family lipid kinase [Anaerolineales bacterium]
MPRKVKLILNPMADMGRAWKTANALRPIAQEFDGELTWSGTVYPTHAIELARQAAEEGYDMVIAMGGDGTVHEVMNGLMQVPAEKRPIMGVVPIGSGNDFAYSLGLTQRSAHALAHALKGESIQSVDIGQMTDEHGRKEYFDNTLGIGFDAVVTIRSHKLPIVKGFLMYLTAVIQTIILNHNPAQVKIETDTETWQSNTLMVTLCNGPREGGGFMLSPESRNTDGKMEYVIVNKVSRGMMFRLVPEFMNGTHMRFKQIRMGSFKTFSLTSDRPLYIHADGEIFTSFGSNLRKVSFEILPQALKVVRG